MFDSETEIEMAHATDPIENCNNPNPTEHEMEIGIEKEYKNDEMYNCAKCSLQFHDRPSIIDHLNPHIDQRINCCNLNAYNNKNCDWIFNILQISL